MLAAHPWFLMVVLAARSAAQSPVPTPDPVKSWWLSAQVNVIYQWHAAFPAAYSGTNSLRPDAEHAASHVETFYSGVRLFGRTEALLDLESTGGGGISQALGLAGFTNLDVVRNPTLGSAPYVARALLRTTIGFGTDTEAVTRGPFEVLSTLPTRRLSIAVGKMSLVDFFDVNDAGSDSHEQFLNWTVDNNGAYDYAADTRGYTIGTLVEYHDRGWALRWAEAVMPTVANGIEYDWHLSQAHADNVELEVDRGLIPHTEGAIRVLGYVNHANMGSYREAIDAFLAGTDSVPDITAHRQPGRTKAGVGVNIEQSAGHGIEAFGRAGLTDGQVESFAYTEVDQALELGVAWVGPPWRKQDRLGVAFSNNGLASDHREYLARGGLGFLLGDGALNYGPEQIVEAYYTCAAGLGVSFAVDVQHIDHPGHNRDRGPVNVFALRAHLDVPR